ncbi:hypothetical protein CK203_022902 [Vitis vinifera]|uniref:Uncharacterized protein n=1 Tax=Vitis vinifera TaxID=29760 RepID=A0A438IW45_VITVI|nr:hypothetical protein CK203_069858 [Vitis vinifera]RVX00960.1 hypothetical protein CK203_022902 [Vitis vinifera]
MDFDHYGGMKASVLAAISSKIFFRAWSMVTKLTEERASALQQNQKLRQELVCSKVLID